MADHLQNQERSEAISPAFDFSSMPEDVQLRNGRIRIIACGVAHEGEGEILLSVLPRPSLRISGRFLGVSEADCWHIAIEHDQITKLYFEEHLIDGFVIDVDKKDGVLSILWIPEKSPLLIASESDGLLHRSIFHLFNFYDFGRNGRRRKDGVVGEALFKYAKWRVRLNSIDVIEDAVQQQRRSGGVVLTTVAEITSPEGPFSVSELSGLLESLDCFLSFVRGGRSGPVCVVGLDHQDRGVWASFCSPRQIGYNLVSWFDYLHIEQVESLFPKFMVFWGDGEWRTCIKEVVYWYLNSNAAAGGVPGVDAGVILTQAALERLSYQYVVKHRRMLQAKGFKSLAASDKFRLLFSSLNLPLQVPDCLPEIRLLQKKNGWVDAPHAITEIRNGLTHPDGTRVGEAYFESWKLSLWYLELALLAVLGYDGTYGNRLISRTIGKVDNIPWNNKS